MSRKTTVAPAVQHGPHFVGATPPDMAAQEAHRIVSLAKIAEQFGDGLPYHRDRYVDKCRFHMSRSAEAALEVGRCLVVMKENEQHGQWLMSLEEIGIDTRLAQRMMKAAVKLQSNAALTPHLTGAAKSRTKLLELMILDDEELRELGEGGSVAGLTLDDIECMTVSTLRAALREARETDATKDRLMADKNAKIDDLVSKLEKKPKKLVATPWPEKFVSLNDEMSAIGSIADEVMGKHLTFIDAIESLADNTPEEHMGSAKSCIHRVGEAVHRLCHLAASLRDQYETRLGGYVANDLSHILPAADAA